MSLEVEEIEVSIRPTVPSDLNFIISSWKKCYKQSATNYWVPSIVYERRQLDTITRLIERGCSILVACNSQDFNEIFGYLVYERIDDVNIAHFLYIKSEQRRQGIGSALMVKAGFDLTDTILVSHTTPYLQKKNFCSPDGQSKYTLAEIPNVLDFNRRDILSPNDRPLKLNGE